MLAQQRRPRGGQVGPARGGCEFTSAGATVAVPYNGSVAGVNYGLIMAASAVSTIPMLIVFIIAQRHILDSMASSGLGGK